MVTLGLGMKPWKRRKIQAVFEDWSELQNRDKRGVWRFKWTDFIIVQCSEVVRSALYVMANG